MNGKRYTEEFKIEAVQVTDRGYKIGEVSDRLGVTRKSLRDCLAGRHDGRLFGGNVAIKLVRMTFRDLLYTAQTNEYIIG